MPFIDRITNNMTPKRVYALCKLSYNRNITRKEVKEYMQPQILNNTENAINEVLRFSLKGGLVKESKAGFIKCNLSHSQINNFNSFRYYIANKSLNDPDLIFSRFSSWYIARGNKVYNDSPEVLIREFDKEINVSSEKNIYNKTNLVAWRTWANFLGLGFIHNGKLIPNLAVRIKDVIKNNNFKEKNDYVFTDFINKLNKHAKEIDGGEIFIKNQGDINKDNKEISLALSNGLRILEEKDLIEMRSVSDSLDRWHLIEPEKDISDIIIKDLIYDE